MLSPYYAFGILTGIVIGLIVLFLRRKNCGSRQYDERQIIGRGKAHQAGFFSLLISNSVLAFLELFEVLPGNSFLWHFAALALGILVFVVTAIHYDAYISMTDNPGRFTRMGMILCIAMLPAAISNYDSGNTTGFFMSVTIMLLWAVVLVALFLHSKKQKQEDEE